MIQNTLDRFLSDFAIGHPASSARTYREALKRFAEFADSVSVNDATRLSADHALAFARWLDQERGKPLARSTFRTYLSAVARLYAYLLRERVITLDGADLERMHSAYRDYRRGTSQRLPKLPPDEIVSALLASARAVESESGDTPRAKRHNLERLRNIALLELLRSSGIRVGELVSLKRGDLDWRARSARVIGKGDKQRIAYFDASALDAVRSYLKLRGDGATGRALDDLPLFASHGKRAGKRVLPLVTNTVRFVFAELAQRANADWHITPHSLRHAFATRMLEETGDLAVVQDLLGHASPTTTRVYAKVSGKRLRDAHRQVFGE